MTFNELLQKFMEICPNGEMGEDIEGQLVFHTGLKEVRGESELQEFPPANSLNEE